MKVVDSFQDHFKMGMRLADFNKPQISETKMYLRLLYFHLTRFACSCPIARSVHLLCNFIVNSSWLLHNRVKHVIVT